MNDFAPRPRQTKIVATLGPASKSVAMIRCLADAGANVFRMNFSHGTHEDHAAVHAAIRKVEADIGRPIAILADLQGPKLRIGKVADGARDIKAGEKLCFCVDGKIAGSVPLPHPNIFETISDDDLILIDDGRIRLRVTGVERASFTATALGDATLRDHKGVNFPDTVLDIEAITPKDHSDLKFALGLGVDWVAMSFVQRAEDIISLREIIGHQAKIISKIEKPVAVENIDAILAQSDAIMVARGDLGVECNWHELPAIQATLVAKARGAGVPVVVATQMLESMISAPLPTRAEASDVANAVAQGADAVMLSAESAAGEFPRQAVSAMASIAAATEAAARNTGRKINADLTYATDDSDSIASAAGVLAELRDACCIATYTETGATALRVAKTRCDVPVLAVCPTPSVARALGLVWGVTSVVNTDPNEFAAARAGQIPPQLAPDQLIQPDRPVIVTFGSTQGQSGSTDTLKIAYLST